MAVRVELAQTAMLEALDKAIMSAKRAANNTKTPLIKECYEKQTRELQHAINTITEVK